MADEERKYHGEVSGGNEGGDFFVVESFKGYGTLVTLKITQGAVIVDVGMQTDEARELIRHLTAAAAACEP